MKPGFLFICYVSNLDSDKRVEDNIIFPLKEGFEKEQFDGKFSMPVHSFVGYCEE